MDGQWPSAIPGHPARAGLDCLRKKPVRESCHHVALPIHDRLPDRQTNGKIISALFSLRGKCAFAFRSHAIGSIHPHIAGRYFDRFFYLCTECHFQHEAVAFGTGVTRLIHAQHAWHDVLCADFCVECLPIPQWLRAKEMPGPFSMPLLPLFPEP